MTLEADTLEEKVFQMQSFLRSADHLALPPHPPARRGCTVL